MSLRIISSCLKKERKKKERMKERNDKQRKEIKKIIRVKGIGRER